MARGQAGARDDRQPAMRVFRAATWPSRCAGWWAPWRAGRWTTPGAGRRGGQADCADCSMARLARGAGAKGDKEPAMPSDPQRIPLSTTEYHQMPTKRPPNLRHHTSRTEVPKLAEALVFMRSTGSTARRTNHLHRPSCSRSPYTRFGVLRPCGQEPARCCQRSRR